MRLRSYSCIPCCRGTPRLIQRLSPSQAPDGCTRMAIQVSERRQQHCCFYDTKLLWFHRKSLGHSRHVGVSMFKMTWLSEPLQAPSQCLHLMLRNSRVRQLLQFHPNLWQRFPWFPQLALCNSLKTISKHWACNLCKVAEQ
jgi:hypothetical protein